MNRQQFIIARQGHRAMAGRSGYGVMETATRTVVKTFPTLRQATAYLEELKGKAPTT